MNSGKKGNKRTNHITKRINLFLLLATLFLSGTGIQVQAADNDDKIVIKVRIVAEETSEETETVEEQPVAVETDEMVAETFEESADILDILSEEELYYFAQCVQIEAEGESLEGKIAVASVLTNRVNSNNFPNTYAEVVSQQQNGVYQFSSYSCSVWGKKEISEETYEAIRTVLTDGSNVGNATYFANLHKVTSGWFYEAQENGTLVEVAEIGLHTFFRTN